MRHASARTLRNSKKIRLNYAYRAIERDTMSGEPSLVPKADDAMDRLGTMRKEEMLDWAFRELDYRLCTD